MDAIGRVTSGVAQDFNNLLTVIAGHAQLVLFSLSPEDPLREDIEEIQKAAERASDLTRQLQTFSRSQPVQLQPVALDALVASMEKMLRRVTGDGIELVLLPDPDLLPVRADAAQLEQAVANLVTNARDAMDPGGRLTLRLRNVELGGEHLRAHPGPREGAYVALAVSDTGAGMADFVKERLFEPFFTTKERRRGTGLGLATVYGVVRQAGGHIEVDSEIGRGTTITVYLPAVARGA